jgi:4-amino-4-deoxy-L-arabinose transferase-like glycosyltransferase
VNRQSSGEIASRDEQAHAASFVRALQSPRLDLWALAAILVIAAISMATALTRFSTEYDEGVYWQSLRAMAHGHALYSSVFGSQPPGFLLGVYPGYLLLGQSIVAGRVVIALYALAGIVAIYVIGRALGGRWVGVLAAGLLALNPRHLQEATTLHAEIPSLTLSLVGIALVAVVMRGTLPQTWRCLLIAAAGVALGLAIMMKLLAVVALVPAVLLIAWPLVLEIAKSRAEKLPISASLSRQTLVNVAQDIGLLLAGLFLACIVTLAPFLPQWGTLYEQVIGFHLVARGTSSNSPIANLLLLPDVTWLVAALGLAVALWRRMWVALPLLGWLLAGMLVLAVQQPLFDPHVLIVAPPLALLGALGSVAAIEELRTRWDVRARGTLLAGATLVALAATLLAGLWLDVRQTRAAETYTGGVRAQMVQALRDPAIPAGPVVTDDQYVAALAGRDTPPELVDTSLVRIATGSLTTAEVERIIGRDDVHVVLFATDRLDRLPGLRAWVEANFQPVATFGSGQTLYIRRAPLTRTGDSGS